MLRFLLRQLVGPAILLLIMIIFTNYVKAEIAATYAPPAFDYQGRKAVFVDIQKADYRIVFDNSTKMAIVESSLVFEQKEVGYVVFDLVATPSLINLDGRNVSSEQIYLPSNVSQVRLLTEKSSTGTHILKVRHNLTELVRFSEGGVSAAFWTSDLDDRNFLERYLPANLEFDQMPITLLIEFKDNTKKQRLYTNGKVSQLSANTWQVEYPEYFTASSLYFHTAPEGTFKEERAIFKSVDGRDIPVLAYNVNGGSGLIQVKNKALDVLNELERDYGAFPHSQVVIYNAGSGGMEYCGATMTELRALGHELTHSYFARGIMPANGNAGWIDEALASWRDNNYPSLESVGSMSTRMAAHPLYTRITDTAAYSSGARFMAHLNYRFKNKGGLKVFLRDLLERRLFLPLITEEFKKDLETFYKDDLSALFSRSIYGQGKVITEEKESTHPFHHKMKLSELRNYL